MARRRRNPTSDAWWVFGAVAGASALFAGIAYLASGTSPAPAVGGVLPPTTPPATPTGTPTPTPTGTPAPSITLAPVTQLVQGNKYVLRVTCTSPITRPTAADFPFLSGATIGAVSPTALLLSAMWIIDFTYTGATVPVPSLTPPSGCTATLSNPVPIWGNI